MNNVVIDAIKYLDGWINISKSKLRVHKSVTRPMLMYSCDVWTLTLKEENNLLKSGEISLAKNLWNDSNDNWRIRKNLEIDNLMSLCKVARLLSLAYVERRAEDRATKEHISSDKLDASIGRTSWVPLLRCSLERLEDLGNGDWQQQA